MMQDQLSRSRFQSFAEASERAEGPGRLAALRKVLKEEGLDGFLVPKADEHQSEYVPKSEERFAWLTGFTGSAGLCVVLPEIAAVFVDGRYTLQVRERGRSGGVHACFDCRYFGRRLARGTRAQGRGDRL